MFTEPPYVIARADGDCTFPQGTENRQVHQRPLPPAATVVSYCTGKHPWSILYCNGERFGCTYGALRP